MQPPVRIVLDTNVLVSGLLKRNSPPGRILDLILSGRSVAVLDARLMREYAEVLARPRLQIPPDPANQVLLFLATAEEWIPAPKLTLDTGEIRDRSDLPFAEIAVAGKVDALVTGNKKHFTLLEQYAIPVLTPVEFLDLISQM